MGVVERLKVTACSTELDASDVFLFNRIEATGDVGGDNNACIGKGSCEVWFWKFASESCDVEQEGSQTGDVGFSVVEDCDLEYGRIVSSSFSLEEM